MAMLIYDEVELFLVCLGLGALLAFIYDVVRVFRLLFRHKDWLVDVEDLLFWIFTAWLVFRTLFAYNRGALRGYAFLGMFLGVMLYALTLSRLFLLIVEKMLPYWRKVGDIMKKPFLFFAQFMRKRLKNIITQVKMAVKGR